MESFTQVSYVSFRPPGRLLATALLYLPGHPGMQVPFVDRHQMGMEKWRASSISRIRSCSPERLGSVMANKGPRRSRWRWPGSRCRGSIDEHRVQTVGIRPDHQPDDRTMVTNFPLFDSPGYSSRVGHGSTGGINTKISPTFGGPC